MGDSQRAYRKNLERYTGLIPGHGYHAHHTFPKAPGFADEFAERGIDVNDPAQMVWREAGKHRGELSDEHSKAWRKYFKDFNKGDTKETVWEARDRIETKVFGNTRGDNLNP
jgi:hypothetical protein